MRLLLISDVHANPWALGAIERDAGRVDHVICAGDAVNYGPDPSAVIHWLNRRGAAVVRGNHDHAVAFDVDPMAAPDEEPLALAMRDWTRQQLSPAEFGWLLSLPRRLSLDVGGAKIEVVHGTPVDPLYDYRLTPACDDALLAQLTTGVDADLLVVGHTHLPLLRRRDRLRVVNPGSAGQPLDGDPRAAYAVWEDGAVQLRRVEYDRSGLKRRLRELPLAPPEADKLLHTFEHGRIDAPSARR